MSSHYEDTWKRDPRSFVGAAHADPAMQLSCLLTVNRNLGVSQNYGYLFGGPHNKDYSILGSILGSPYFGKLPFRYCQGSIGGFQEIRSLP